jgi:hypothetical protein
MTMGFSSTTIPLAWVSAGRYRVTGFFSYVTKSGIEIRVRRTLVTDFGTFRIMRAFLRPDGAWAPAMVIHDALYGGHTFGAALQLTRKDSDDLLIEMCDHLGVNKLLTRSFHLGSRVLGRNQWIKYRGSNDSR